MEAGLEPVGGMKTVPGPVVQIDEGRIQAHLNEVVRASVEEALIEMYLAGVSERRVEDITQALWGTRVRASTVSDLNQKIYGKINEWRERPLGAIFLMFPSMACGCSGAGATNEGGGRVPGRPVGTDAGSRAATPCGRDQVGNQTLLADGPAGRSRGHRLTALLLAPMGGRSKTTPTQRPSCVRRKIESAKNSGHYPGI